MKITIFDIQMPPERARWIRSILITSIVSGLIGLGALSFIQNCLLNVFQNIILPIIGMTLFVNNQPMITKSQWYKHGAFLGGIIGVVGAASLLIFQSIGYYVLGGRDAAAAIAEFPYPPLTPQVILFDALLLIPLWLVSVGVSLLAGLVGAAISAKKVTHQS